MRHCPLSPIAQAMFLRRRQAAHGVCEQGLEWMGGTEVKPDERELPLYDGADLDQFEPDRLAGGLGELGAGKRQAPDRFHERVGQAGYLRDVLPRFPVLTNRFDLDTLTPVNWQPQ